MAIPTSTRKAHFGRIDRRNDSRIPCKGDTVIDVLSPQARSSVQARIIDVSESSLKLSLPFHVSPGSLLRIHMSEGGVAHGEARYCTSEGAEYHVGVKIDEVAPKSD